MNLLVVLEREEELVFLLDGNTLTLEDYLEIRPEKRPELEKIYRSGTASGRAVVLYAG